MWPKLILVKDSRLKAIFGDFLFSFLSVFFRITLRLDKRNENSIKMRNKIETSSCKTIAETSFQKKKIVFSGLFATL